MRDHNYIQWKNWNMDHFGTVSPRLLYYYSRIFNDKQLSGRCKILEIGFGNGSLLGYLRQTGHHVSGVEVNEHLVERARISGYKAYCGQVWEIGELQKDAFDFIIAFDVAEHMTGKELRSLFIWVKGHLSEKGRLILKFPEGASPFGLAAQNGDFTHVTILTRSKIEALCCGSGMALLSYKDDMLSSNTLCSRGLPGIMVLKAIQIHANFLKMMLRLLLYPLSRHSSFATNSIAVIADESYEQ